MYKGGFSGPQNNDDLLIADAVMTRNVPSRASNRSNNMKASPATGHTPRVPISFRENTEYFKESGIQFKVEA